jgi:hypothetical protein
MKELGTALLLYINDYDAVLPSSVLYARSKMWNKSNFIKFAKLRGNLPPTFGNKTGNSWPMLLYPHMRNKDIIWCPSDPNRNDSKYGAKIVAVSYYYKAAVDAAWFGGPGGKGPVCRKEGDFAFPADQIIFYEHNGWHWGDQNKGLANGVTINCTFMDGHVQAKRIKSSGYTAEENPPEPLPKCGIGEPAWFNYDFDKRSGNTSESTRSYGYQPAPNDAGWNSQKGGDMLP